MQDGSGRVLAHPEVEAGDSKMVARGRKQKACYLK
jgi:hypothetical protein